MSASLFPEPEDPIDRLVRKVRDAEANRTDVGSFLARLNQVQPADRRRGRRWFISAIGTMAAGLLLAVFLLLPSGKTMTASPAELIACAQKAHDSRAEMTYQVTTRWNSEGRKLIGFPHAEWETVLHVRDDRFYLERRDGKPGAWGRDEKGRAWGVLGSRLALTFEADEIPEPLRDYLEIRSMRPTKILETFLKQCDLSWGDESHLPGMAPQIVAVPRDESDTKLRRATLLLSSDQNLIERMVIERELHPGETVQITFKRIDAPAVDSSRFTPEGHLEAGGKVWDRSRPLVRLQFFREFLGK